MAIIIHAWPLIFVLNKGFTSLFSKELEREKKRIVLTTILKKLEKMGCKIYAATNGIDATN